MIELPPLLDTNILVYFFDESDSGKYLIARKLIDSSWDGNVRWTVSAQNLTEFYIAVTRRLKKPLSPALAVQFIKDICSHDSWLVLEIGKSTLNYASDIIKLYDLSFLDAQIAASMLKNNALTIYTEDSDFAKVKGLKVVNPFKDSKS